jgi:hypothetical protein
MAAIGRNARRSSVAALGCVLLAICAAGHADDSTDAREQVSRIASALTEGNPSGAMMPFDKSYANYEKLRTYFSGLTTAFQIVNGIDVSDEEEEHDQIKLSVHWDMALIDLQTNYTENRAADLKIKLARVNSKWKIVDMEPVDFFNPARTGSRTGSKISAGVSDLRFIYIA